MRAFIVGFGVSILGIIAGCATTNVHGVPMNEVIDTLKAELNSLSPMNIQFDDEPGCEKTGHYSIVAFPTKASVQLKTVLTTSNTGGLGGTFGIPIVVAPTFTAISTSVKTTQSTLAFCVVPETLDNVKDKKPSDDCTWTLRNAKKPYITELWPTKTVDVKLPKYDPKGPKTVIPVKASGQPPDSDLASIFRSTITGMVYADHKKACLLPQNIDAQVAFEVTGERDAGLKLTFGIVNISDTQTWKRDFTNTIDVTFLLNKGSTTELFLDAR
jgi:hypothetical protein